MPRGSSSAFSDQKEEEEPNGVIGVHRSYSGGSKKFTDYTLTPPHSSKKLLPVITSDPNEVAESVSNVSVSSAAVHVVDTLNPQISHQNGKKQSSNAALKRALREKKKSDRQLASMAQNNDNLMAQVHRISSRTAEPHKMSEKGRRRKEERKKRRAQRQ